MKKLSLALVLLAAPVVAQETYSLPASATNVSELAAVVAGANARLAARYALASTATQSQVCTAAVAAGTTVGGGAACSAAQARAADIRIFPATQAGREEFVTFQIAIPAFLAMKASIVSIAQEQQCRNWQAFDQTQKDAACVASGLSAGCILCP